MELLGQYLVYRMALDYLLIQTPLYIAIPQAAYHSIIQHVIGQEMMRRYAVPLLVFDPVREEILEWIPAL